MRFVLLKMGDAEAERLIRRDTKGRVVGLYEIPDDLCDCELERLAEGYFYDPAQKRPVCRKCKKVHQIYLKNLKARVRWALGLNIVKSILGHDGTEDF